jgi:O-antigen/teichoic acid export membrane protein
VVERVVLLGVPIAIAVGGAGPLQASWTTVAILGIVEVLLVREVFRRTPVPISPRAGSLREGFQLVGPSLFFFGAALSTQLVATGITLVISNAAGAVAVVTFTTALMMTNLFRLVINQVVNVLSSEVTLLLGGEELDRLRNWYRFLWKGSLIATIASATLLCPIGPLIIRMWTRGRVQVDFELNLLLTLYLIAHAAGILSIGFGLAMNKQRRIFFVQVFTGVAALLTGAALVHKLGLHGIAWSLLLVQSLSTAALTRMNCRWLRQHAGRFVQDAIGRGLPTFAFVVAGVAAARNLETLPFTLVAISCSLAGCLLLSWFTWLNPWERQWLRSSVRELVQCREFRSRPVGLTV